MKNPNQLPLLLFTLVFLLSSSEVRPIPEDRRYTRGTKFQGISTEIHRDSKLESGDDLHINAVSTSSITTSTQPQPAVAHVLSIHVPSEAFQVHHEHGTAGISTFHSSESVVGATSSVLQSPPPAVAFIRPEGSLPIPPDRFGFDKPRPLHPGAVPNCGCVSRGACLGEVGAYTRLVLPYTDVVCGHRFQTCCFDGPWAGDYDSFAIAAACVPKEECARPYGVLPTDVRDFGVIAPCPGQGAVRCIAVNSEELLVFQATVAAIDAANANYHSHQEFQPVHLMVPILSGTGGAEGATTIEATSTSSVSALTSHGDPKPSVVVQGPSPGSNILIQEASPPQPNIIIHAAPAQPDITIHQAPPPHQNINIHAAAPPQPNINIHAAPAQPDITIHQAPPPHQNINIHAAAPPQPNINIHQAPVQPDVNIEVPTAHVTVLTAESPVGPAVTPLAAPVPPPVVIPPAAVPGYYSPYYARAFPWGYGVGGGLGIRKRISFSKGFIKG